MEETVLYETQDPILTSMLRDGFIHKKYSWWKAKYFQFLPNGKLYYSKIRGIRKDCYMFDISEARLERIQILIETENCLGITVHCRKDNMEAAFRCIIPNQAILMEMCKALKDSSPNNVRTVDDFLREFEAHNPFKNDDNVPYTPRKGFVKLFNDAEARSIVLNTRENRGAFKFLPVFFRNDLVHGSWWFVFGSIFITIVSVIVIVNKQRGYNFMGDDDSYLSPAKYLDSWILLSVSGFFFTVGSVAFVRAMSDPPMRPMFSCYHCQSDELFGSWMFALGTFPGIPWSMIYLSDYHSLLYLGLLAAACIAFLGCLLFVFACYPSKKTDVSADGRQQEHKKRSAVLVPYLMSCCCIKTTPMSDEEAGEGGDSRRLSGSGCWERIIKTHCTSDWLIGSWVVFWGTLLCFVCFAGFTFFSFSYANEITNFVNLTTTLDTFFFLIGSMYFVAGSYEQRHMMEKDYTVNIQSGKPASQSQLVQEVELHNSKDSTGSNRGSPRVRKGSKETAVVHPIGNAEGDVLEDA